MRHRIFGKILGRTHNQRKALIRGLVRSFFTHGKIQTTEAKAKLALRDIERMAHLASDNTLVSKREMFKTLQSQSMVNQITKVITTEFPGQKSNFTRVKKVKIRPGDASVVVELSMIKPVSFKAQDVAPTKAVPSTAAPKVKKVTKKATKAATK